MTADNFKTGVLMDHEWMAGVTEDPQSHNNYLLYVINYLEGEYLLYTTHNTLESALSRLAQIDRGWKFESFSRCGNGNCKNNDQGSCTQGGCKAKTDANECVQCL
jgi:hypothetical protein